MKNHQILRANIWAAASLGLVLMGAAAGGVATPARANIVNPTCPTNTVIHGSYQPNTGGGNCKCPVNTYAEMLQPNSFECMPLGHMTAAQRLHDQAMRRTGTCGGRGQKACPVKQDTSHPTHR
jgi:hypothetical protein